MGNQAVLTIGAKAHSATTSAFAAISKGMKSIAAGMREQAKALKEVGNTKAADTLNKTAKSMSGYAGQVTKNVNTLKSMVVAEDKVTKTRERGLKAINQSTAASVKAGKQMDSQSKKLASLAAEMDKASKKTNVFNRAITKLGKSFKTYLSYTIVAGALLQVRQAFAASTAVIIDYDQALHDLQAITQATADETVQMGLKITDVATKTKFSLSEVADGMKTLGQAGFTASESIAAIQGVSDLATGTLTGIKTTVDLVSTAIRVFKLEFSDASHVADVFANAVNGSKLTIDKLRTSFNYIGPIAKLSGVSFEELTSTMMSLANQGIRASTIGTGLRQVFSKLVKPTKEFENAILNTGLTLADLNPKYNDMETIISNLSLVVNDAEDAFRFFGMRGSAAVAALVEGGSEEFLKMQKLVGRTGIAAEMAAVQMEGLAIAFKNLRDRSGVLAKELGEAGLTSVFRVFLSVTKPLVILLTDLVDNGLTPIIVSGLAATAALVGLVSAFQLLAGFKWVAAMFAAINGTLIGTTIASASAVTGLTTLRVAMLALPWGWIAAGIGLVVVGLTAFFGASGRATKSLDRQIASQRNLQEQLKSASNELEEMNKIGLSDVEIKERQEKIVFKLIEEHEEFADVLVTNIHNTEGLTAAIEALHQAASDDILNTQFEKMLLKIDLYDDLVKQANHYQNVKNKLASGEKTIYNLYSENKLKLIKSVSIKAKTELDNLVGAFAKTAALLNAAGLKFDESALKANKGLYERFKIAYDKLFVKAEVATAEDASEKASKATKALSQARLDLLTFQSQAQFLTKNKLREKIGEDIKWKMPWVEMVKGAGPALEEEVRKGLFALREKLSKDPKYKDTLINTEGYEEELELFFQLSLKKFERFAVEKNRMEQRLIQENEGIIATIRSANADGGAKGKEAIIKAEGVEELRQKKVIWDNAKDHHGKIARLQALVNSDSEATSIVIQKSLDNMNKAARIYKTTLTTVGTANTEANLAITEEHVKQQIKLANLQGKSYEKDNANIANKIAAGEILVHVGEKQKLLNEESALLEKESTIHNAKIAAYKLDGAEYSSLQKKLDKDIQDVTADIASNTADITSNKKDAATYTASILSLEVQLKNLKATGAISKDLDAESKAGKQTELREEKRLQAIAVLNKKYNTAILDDKNRIKIQIDILEQQGRNDELVAAQELYQARLTMLGDWRERVKLTTEEINQIYKDAADAGVITAQQMHDKQVEETGTFLERLKLKWDKYLGTRKSDEETMADFMEEKGKQGVDGIVDSLMELENSTESAAESFKNMALSIAKDIQRMIIKMLIMKAIGAAMNWWSGSAGSEVPVTSSGYMVSNIAHSGKQAGSFSNVTRQISAGFADIKHSGVGSDERLTIIRNNESVLTPSQMKEGSGAPIIVQNTITVPIEQAKDEGSAQAFGKTVASMLEVTMTQFVVKNKRPGGLFSNA